MRTRTASTVAIAAVLSMTCFACSSNESPDSGHDSGHDVASDTGTDVVGTDTAEDTTPTDSGVDATTDTVMTDAADATDVTGDTGTGTGGDHLLISEIGTQPSGAEFVEISNPTSAAIDLSDYYLSDNSNYFNIAMGMPFNPITNNPGTDFLVRFPSGASIPAGGVIVVATGTMFPTVFNRCPNFVLAATALNCTGGGTAAPMVVPTNGDLGTMPGDMLSNAREMVVLFHWSGSTSDRLQDVDYVTWGDAFEAGSRADKTAVTGYHADTAPAMQHGAPAPATNQSIERCGADLGETLSGGNGITGHDETSERLDMSFRVQTVRTPGVANSCP